MTSANTKPKRSRNNKDRDQGPALRYYSSASDHIYRFLAYLLCGVSVVVIVIPLIFVLAASFSTPKALLAARVFLWPVEFNLRGYALILEHQMMMTSYLNSIIYTVVGTSINVVMTILAAYPLSRRDLGARNAVMLLFTFTMLFNGGMIPMYLQVRNLGMLDSIWAMVIPNALSVWNLIITRTYFQSSIPSEMFESASIDGCDDFRFLLRIAIPLSAPIIAVNLLLYAVGHWNAYFNALIYLNSNEKFTLQLVLRQILAQTSSGVTMDVKDQLARTETRYLLQYSTIVVSTLPVMLLYPFVQRYFVRGIMVGAIKG